MWDGGHTTLETRFYYNVEFLPRACLCTLELRGPQCPSGPVVLILGEGKKLLGGPTCLCEERERERQVVSVQRVACKGGGSRLHAEEKDQLPRCFLKTASYAGMGVLSLVWLLELPKKVGGDSDVPLDVA